MLGSCAPVQRISPAPPPPPVQAPPPSPPTPANALAAGVYHAGPVGSIEPAVAARALAAFRTSCPALVTRADVSGLAPPDQWRDACAAAETVTPAGAAAFFRTNFDAVRVGDGSAFATGYYEPQIAGSRVRSPGYTVPIYAVPGDLVSVETAEGPKRGRLVDGAYALYHDRAAIDGGALAGRGLEIAWAADPIDLFFLQIQGSGRLALPDGSVIRIGYAGQNGREYLAIGRLMKERGLFGDRPVTMQAITAWLRANPAEATEILHANKSYVFFRELTGPGPLGALGLPVTPRASVAADPRFVPLGAPVLLAMDRAEASGLWIAQDIGGAIKGANRFDTFWGAGDEAARIAGGMQGRGAAVILLPRGAAARIAAGSDAPPR